MKRNPGGTMIDFFTTIDTDAAIGFIAMAAIHFHLIKKAFFTKAEVK